MASNDCAGRRAADLGLAGVGAGAAALDSTAAAGAAAASLAAAAVASTTAAAAAASTTEAAAAIGLILYRLDEPIDTCRVFIRLSRPFSWVAPRACTTSARLTAR